MCPWIPLDSRYDSLRRSQQVTQQLHVANNRTVDFGYEYDLLGNVTELEASIDGSPSADFAWELGSGREQ